MTTAIQTSQPLTFDQRVVSGALVLSGRVRWRAAAAGRSAAGWCMRVVRGRAPPRPSGVARPVPRSRDGAPTQSGERESKPSGSLPMRAVAAVSDLVERRPLYRT